MNTSSPPAKNFIETCENRVKFFLFLNNFGVFGNVVKHVRIPCQSQRDKEITKELNSLKVC